MVGSEVVGSVARVVPVSVVEVVAVVVVVIVVVVEEVVVVLLIPPFMPLQSCMRNEYVRFLVQKMDISQTCHILAVIISSLGQDCCFCNSFRGYVRQHGIR